RRSHNTPQPTPQGGGPTPQHKPPRMPSTEKKPCAAPAATPDKTVLQSKPSTAGSRMKQAGRTKRRSSFPPAAYTPPHTAGANSGPGAGEPRWSRTPQNQDTKAICAGFAGCKSLADPGFPSPSAHEAEGW